MPVTLRTKALKYNMTKNLVIHSLFLLVVFFLYKIVVRLYSFNDTILLVTAIILFWYTWETYQIKKANLFLAEESKENLKLQRRPIIGFEMDVHPENKYKNVFTLINLANHPVAVKVKCTFKIDEKIIEKSIPSYNGIRYWNLQINQTKYGNFSWLDLLYDLNIFTTKDIDNLKTLSRDDFEKELTSILIYKYNFGRKPSFTMGLTIIAINEFNECLKYPKIHYQFCFDRIPELTDEKPFWQQDEKPILKTN